jgi:hypothetical protein
MLLYHRDSLESVLLWVYVVTVGEPIMTLVWIVLGLLATGGVVYAACVFC